MIHTVYAVRYGVHEIIERKYSGHMNNEKYRLISTPSVAAVLRMSDIEYDKYQVPEKDLRTILNTYE